MLITIKAYCILIISGILTIIGCFLPWEYSGGFIAYPLNGINITPTMRDNGGVIIISIVVIIWLLFIIIKNENKAIAITLNIPAIVILLIAILRIISFIINKSKFGNIEPPMLGIGIILILLGSIILVMIGIYSTRKYFITNS